jgi:hypothetical protein
MNNGGGIGGAVTENVGSGPAWLACGMEAEESSPIGDVGDNSALSPRVMSSAGTFGTGK